MTIRGVRRRALVAAGVALLCGLPVIASALPVSVPRLTASQFRARILAAAGLAGDARPVAGRRALRRRRAGHVRAQRVRMMLARITRGRAS